MKATYRQRGETIDYINAGSDAIEAGTVVGLDKRIGVAGMDIAVGETGTLHVMGVYTLTKNTGESMTAGQIVYFDEAEDEITGTAMGNIPAGWVVEAAESADEEVYVCIADINTTTAAAVAEVSATDAEAAAGAAPTKAEYDVAVTLANANKTAINAMISAMKAAGIMETS